MSAVSSPAHVVDRARDAALDAAAAVAAGGPEQPLTRDRDDWRLDERSLAYLEQLVARLRPRAVLELGSGASTVTLGAAVAANVDGGCVTTLESDPEHVARTRICVEQAGLAGVVEIVAAPLVARRRRGRMVPTYHLDDMPRLTECAWAELILVDGPPLPLGGREGALDQALELALPGAVVVLDDSRRDSERELLVRALEFHAGRVEAMDLLGFPKGLAVMVVTAPVEASS